MNSLHENPWPKSLENLRMVENYNQDIQVRILIIFFVLYSANLCANSTLIYDAKKKDISLTEKDRDVLEVGEISNAKYVIGGILGTYPIGLGLGHAVQGRWDQTGWIFTAGELSSIGVLLVGVLSCDDDNSTCSDLSTALIVTGVIGYIGFRLWEIGDVWVAPFSHNRKVRELKDYINKTSAPTVKSSLNLVPVINPKMGQGLGLTFTF